VSTARGPVNACVTKSAQIFSSVLFSEGGGARRDVVLFERAEKAGIGKQCANVNLFHLYRPRRVEVCCLNAAMTRST
jgi:hypothetical protein